MRLSATPFAVMLSVIYLASCGRMNTDRVRGIFSEAAREHVAAFAASDLALGNPGVGGGLHRTSGLLRPRRKVRDTKWNKWLVDEEDTKWNKQHSVAEGDEDGLEEEEEEEYPQTNHEDENTMKARDAQRRRQWRRESMDRDASAAYDSYCDDMESMRLAVFTTTDQRREFVESANTQLAKGLGKIWQMAPAMIQDSQAFKIVLKNVQAWANPNTKSLLERREQLVSVMRKVNEMGEAYETAKLVRNMAASEDVARAADAEVMMARNAHQKLKAEYDQLRDKSREAKIWVVEGRNDAKKLADESFLEGLLQWLHSSDDRT